MYVHVNLTGQAELIRLRKKVEELRMERVILKKAAGAVSPGLGDSLQKAQGNLPI